MEFDIAVVGGGPAGMMAAGTAAENGAKVVLLEKNEKLGAKLLLTGKERCNITNHEIGIDKIISIFGKKGSFLYSALYDFNTKDTINFFTGQHKVYHVNVIYKTHNCPNYIITQIGEKTLFSLFL